jgi:small ubiquitin-related modifier
MLKCCIQVKFLYDGARIMADDTPAKLEMEDNDSIDVVIEQVGIISLLRAC